MNQEVSDRQPPSVPRVTLQVVGILLATAAALWVVFRIRGVLLLLVLAIFFAIDALTVHENKAVLALSIAVALACAGFLPFNLRAGKPHYRGIAPRDRTARVSGPRRRCRPAR